MAALLPMLVLLLSGAFAAPAAATTYQVGPGKPYHRWRQTPEYEDWRRVGAAEARRSVPPKQ